MTSLQSRREIEDVKKILPFVFLLGENHRVTIISTNVSFGEFQKMPIVITYILESLRAAFDIDNMDGT